MGRERPPQRRRGDVRHRLGVDDDQPQRRPDGGFAGAGGLPAERLTSAGRSGLRYAANSHHMRATLMRALAFFPFASAYWALLPLVARHQMTQGPTFYGLLLGAIGVGAILGSFALNW